MIDNAPPDFLKLIANDVRWRLLQALAQGDRRVQELVEAVDLPVNLVSYHLKKLREEALVVARRSEADGRDLYYSLDLERVRQLYQQAGARLHPLVGAGTESSDAPLPLQRVLFICTHNSARSQMAEALLRHASDGAIEAHSAGSHPTQVHPDAIRAMDALGIDIRGQTTHHISDYDGCSFDWVITVCDSAREVCPTFRGATRYLHWGFGDPVVIADADARARAFDQIALRLHTRIQHFLTQLRTGG